MKITLIRTGGFSGIPLKKTIDTDRLEPEKAKEIENVVTSAHFFSLQSPKQNPATDRFTYTISIENNGLTRSISIDEKSLTSQLREIITSLQTI